MDGRPSGDWIVGETPVAIKPASDDHVSALDHVRSSIHGTALSMAAGVFCKSAIERDHGMQSRYP
jgi:hypothetical protein